MNKKLSWLMCSLVVLAVLVTAGATPAPTPAPIPTAAPTAAPTPTVTPALTATPAPVPTPILRFLAEGTVVEVPTSWWAHTYIGTHAVQFAIEDFAEIFDFDPTAKRFFWRDIKGNDLNAVALLRCWTRCETTANLKFPTCFLDVSWVPSEGHIRSIENGEPAFWVEIVGINPKRNALTLAWGDWGKRLPGGELPNVGGDVYLIGNYKGLEWDKYPY